jgi:hypothetical protein
VDDLCRTNRPKARLESAEFTTDAPLRQSFQDFMSFGQTPSGFGPYESLVAKDALRAPPSMRSDEPFEEDRPTMPDGVRRTQSGT